MNARMTMITVAVVAALAAGTALAHGGMGHGPQGRAPMSAEQVAQRLAPLKDALKLQPNQQAAWSAYEGKIVANAQARAKLHEAMPAPADRDAMADFRVTMMKFNAQAAEEANSARKALAASLTPEQKATFDNFRPGPMAGGPGGPGYGPGHRHGGGGQGPGYGPGGGMRGGCTGGQV